MTTLPNAIEALYTAFHGVPKPRVIKGCPCCIEDKNICTLLSEPLRQLTSSELSSYSFSAFLTVGEEADYLYFFPRIIEIACTESGCWPDIELTGRAAANTQPISWPENRRDALIGVVRTVIATAISNNDGRVIDGWICASAKMGLDISIFLEQIALSPKALLAYHEINSHSLMKRKLANSFWDRGDHGYDQIMAWFSSPKISKIISDGYGLTPQ